MDLFTDLFLSSSGFLSSTVLDGDQNLLFFVHSTNDLRYCVYIKQHAFIYSDLIVMVRLTTVTVLSYVFILAVIFSLSAFVATLFLSYGNIT